MEQEPIIAEQIAYYRARAPEYDEWFNRRGRYDRGPSHRAEWFQEINTIKTVLQPLIRGKRILELACGTGLWTHYLAEESKRVEAVDASPEAIAINHDRQRTSNVKYSVADIFEWKPNTTFDLVFFSFWLSHVPSGRFESFWRTVRQALEPEGTVLFIDSLYELTSTARDSVPPSRTGIVQRTLNDGRDFRVVKIFYDPGKLERRLNAGGWRGWVRSTGKFFLHGSMKPAARTDLNCMEEHLTGAE